MRLVTLLCFAALSSGCASYYTHYAVFPAENSRGEPRQVRVSWDTADYPDWWLASDQSTALKLETQCSERIWRLRDDSHEQAGECGTGIRACAEPGVDRRVVEDSRAPSGACVLVNPAQPGARIAGIGERFELLMLCEPVVAEFKEGDEVVNADYLRASAVPYTVYARKAPRGSLNARLPDLDDAVCDD